MRAFVTTLAFVAFCVVLFARAASRDEQPEQREAVYARDGETAEEVLDRLELCTSSSFGFCHSFPR